MAVLDDEIVDTIPGNRRSKIKLNPVIRKKFTHKIICRTMNNGCGCIETANFCITRPIISNAQTVQISSRGLIDFKFYTCYN